MCSTYPANWVTFDDEPLFQSPQKSVENRNTCKANGLNLNLANMHESSSRSSSTSSTPLSSPIADFYLNPGPPSNSPLSTPTKEYSGSPCTPKSGIHILYPIPELSSNINLHPPPGTCSSLAFQKLSTAANDNPPKILFSKQATPGEINPTYQESCNKLEDQLELERFQYFQNDCAFSTLFGKEGCSTSMSPCNVDTQRKDKKLCRGICHPKEKDTCHDQKSLNQNSFSYVCERLEHLQTDTLGSLSASSIHAWHNLSSFIPHSLFRSQKKDGWPIMLRIPEKKNMMSSRQWGPIYLKVLPGGILQMYYEKGLEKPFKEFQLQPYCKLSEPKLENCSVSGKIHTVKIEYVSYTEKRKFHPKAEVVHEPEVEQMLKLGTTDYNDFTDFLATVEEELMKLPAISRLHSMKYCENVMIRFPVPAQWIKALWTMNLQRQKSLKAKMNRKTCLGSLHEVESDPVIQVSIGTAKYESAYRAVVWKIDRLPDKNSSPYQPHSLSYKLELGSDQEIPSDWYPFATVQFDMLDACASGTEVKSLGIECDVQPQKHLNQKTCYNCQVEIEKKWIRLDGEDPDKASNCLMQ
ncbi:stonin-1 isoform X2 [Chrysemys picta bellii]|uniref:stonin-1 isoform X2 n=1 Tax=Chrysemys picta bellii TaxID=8478 RepID=UPI00046C0EBC